MSKFILVVPCLLLGVLGVLMVLLSPYCRADFETDTTPVDMRDYWPHEYDITTYRRWNGTLYVRRITKSGNPMSYWLDKEPDDIHFSREDHFPVEYGSEVTVFNNSWGMVKKDNKAVYESSDSWPPWSSACPDWCGGGTGQYYTGAIIHGRPGGHTLGEGYAYQTNVGVVRSPNYQTTRPLLNPALSTYSITKLVKKYNTFTPEVGRKEGVWRAGGGQEYNNVVLMVFQHGTANTDKPNRAAPCDNAPPGYNHRKDNVSFWVYIWYAPNVGVIQEYILFDERTCTGFSVDHIRTQHKFFIDEVEQ